LAKEKIKNPADEAPEDDDAPAGREGQIIRVRGPEDGRWRGGLWFGPTDIPVDLSTISVKQLKAIMGDPYLSVRPAPPPPAEDPPAGGEAA
jgi:hypothetical protein